MLDWAYLFHFLGTIFTLKFPIQPMFPLLQIVLIVTVRDRHYKAWIKACCWAVHRALAKQQYI